MTASKTSKQAPPGIKRRSFLGMSGAAVGAALLHGCKQSETEFLEQALKRSGANPGEAVWRRSICQQCPGGCELTVRTIDGRAKKIEGDATSPYTAGGVCALGHSALQELYHPQRFLQPSLRQPDGSVSNVTWEEALAAVDGMAESRRSAAANESSSQGSSSGMALCCGPDPLEQAVYERLALAIGATLTIVEPSHSALERQARIEFFGADVALTYNLREADLILVVAASPLDRWGNPVAFASGIAEARARGARLIVASQRMSLTAAKADLWLPILGGPGDLFRLLQAVNTQTGADEGTTSMADEEVAAADFGAPAPQLRDLIESLRKAKNPAVIVGGEGAMKAAEVLAGFELQHALGALPTAFDPHSLLGGPVEPGASVRYPARRSPTQLLTSIASGETSLVVTANADLLGGLPASWGAEDSFSASGCGLVAIASSEDATTQVANLVLPMQTDLERRQISSVPGSDFSPMLTLADPVVESRGEARHPVDIVLAIVVALAKGAGNLPWPDFETLRASIVESNADLNGKTVASVLRSALRSEGRLALSEEALGRAASLSTWSVLEGSAAEAVGKPIENLGQGMRLQLFDGVRGESAAWSRSWLAELPDPMASTMWGSWIEVSPTEAESLGVHTGDAVRVTSSAGVLETTVFVNPATRPGLAFMPIGRFGEFDGVTAADGAETVAGGDPRNLLSTDNVEGYPLTSVEVALEPGGLPARAGAAIFGRGLRSAEQIPAGWKSHQVSGSSVSARDSGSAKSLPVVNADDEQNGEADA